MRIKFAGSSQDFAPLPNDTYRMRIEGTEFSTTSNNNRSLNVTLRIEAPGTEWDNRKHWERFVLVPQSGWRLKDFLEGFQVPHDAVPGAAKGEFEIDFDSDDLVGKVGLIALEQEIYAKEKNGIKTMNPDGTQATGIRSNAKKFSPVV